MPPIDEYSLSNRSAVVTGSSSGIGRAIALQLAGAGADVLVHANRNQTGADEVADGVRRMGREALVVMANFRDAAEQDRFLETAWKWRDIDIWINNAGADVLTGRAAELAFEDKLAALWHVDVVGTLRLSRAAGSRMKRRGRGTIINIGWDQVVSGMEGDSGQLFGASKGAVMAATLALAKSLAPEVRVNCVAPGWIRTAWGEQASADWQTRARRESLLGRWGQPEDVARVVCFLASPAAEFVNGQIINVNGGRTS